MTNIKPLGTLILLQKIEETEKKTASGLVLTASAQEAELQRGTVIAVGDGTRDVQGNLHPLNVQPGDVVYFNEAHLVEVTDDQNNKYHFIAFSNLYGKITNA
jgi:chaperonin GroES